MVRASLSLLLSLLFLSACSNQYPALSRHDPFYIEHPEKNVIPESESYNTYVHRSDEFIQIGEYGPRDGESYSDFERRLYNTLEIQDYEIGQLKGKISRLANMVASLEGQLSQVKKAHTDLKKDVGLQEKWKAYDSRKEKRGKTNYFAKYTVKKGDTLQTIAKNRYGTNTAWLTLYRFNLETLKNGPNNLEVGDQLVLPPVLPPISDRSSRLLSEVD